MQGIGNVLTIAPENIAFTKITKSSLRLIVNETTGKVLYRHMAHDNITAISYDDEHEETNITFASSVPVMTVTDVFSVKLYVQKEDIIPTDYAKQGTNANATLSAVLEALQGSDTPSPDIPEGVAERLALILEYFGIKPISGYGLMDEDDVYDYLEYVAVNMGYITPQQAATITADTRRIIHGGSGSGSGSGSEGGSGSGSEGGAGE